MEDVQAVYVHSHSTHSHCDFCRRAYTRHREELCHSMQGFVWKSNHCTCLHYFSVFAASPPAIADSSLSAVNIVWNYVELIQPISIGRAIKAADRIVKKSWGCK